MGETFDNLALDLSGETSTTKELATVRNALGVNLYLGTPGRDEDAEANLQVEDSEWATSENKPPLKSVLVVLLKFYDFIVRRRGLMLILIADLFYSGKNLCLNSLSKELSTFQAVVMTMPVMLLGSLFMILVKRPPCPRNLNQQLWLSLGGMAAALVTTLLTISLPLMDLADAVTISFSFLTFVGFFSRIFLRDALKPFDFVFCMLAFAGIIFIARPQLFFTTDGQQLDGERKDLLLGVSFSFTSAICMALSIVFFRKQTQLDISQYVAIPYCSCSITMINAITCFALGHWRSPSVKAWLTSTAGGFCFFGAQLLLIVSLGTETATMVSIFLTFEIVCTFVWQFLIYRISPLWTSYVGASLLIVAGVGITLYNSMYNSKDSAQDRRRTTEGETKTEMPMP